MAAELPFPRPRNTPRKLVRLVFGRIILPFVGKLPVCPKPLTRLLDIHCSTDKIRSAKRRAGAQVRRVSVEALQIDWRDVLIGERVSSAQADALADVCVRIVRSAEDRQHLLNLRQRVYVQEQNRLELTDESGSHFAKYEDATTYFLAFAGRLPVAAIKVTADSGNGLPCDQGVDLRALRARGQLVEIGHCITLPEMRWRGVGLRLMREAVRFSRDQLGATHVLVDFFVDQDRALKMKFHQAVGFRPVGEPYPDSRFVGSPISVVAVLDVEEWTRRRVRSR